jgi:pimeloyl-ACP methyl ester carboxylesterase
MRRPPLVVINGLAATSQDWDPAFIAGLAGNHELLLIDNRGMGASADDGAPFSIADLAADVADVLTEPAAMLGWSMGGFIAQQLALEHPELVTKLVLLSTDPGGPETGGDREVIDQLIDTSPPPTEQARRLLSLLVDDDLARELYSQVGDVIAAARARLKADLLQRQRSALDEWHGQGVADRLAEISTPTLIATGTADRVIPSANSLRLASGIPGAWLLQFQGGGHAFMAQHPEKLSGIINAFLAP